MSKKGFGKFLIGSAVIAACSVAFYFVKEHINKKKATEDEDIFEDDFDDDFEDDDFDGFNEEDQNGVNSREYVTINITNPDADKTDDNKDSKENETHADDDLASAKVEDDVK